MEQKHRCYAVWDETIGWSFWGKVADGLDGVVDYIKNVLEDGDDPPLDEVLIQIKIVEMTQTQIDNVPEV